MTINIGKTNASIGRAFFSDFAAILKTQIRFEMYSPGSAGWDTQKCGLVSTQYSHLRVWEVPGPNVTHRAAVSATKWSTVLTEVCWVCCFVKWWTVVNSQEVSLKRFLGIMLLSKLLGYWIARSSGRILSGWQRPRRAHSFAQSNRNLQALN